MLKISTATAIAVIHCCSAFLVMIQKLTALKNVLELTEHKAGLETVKELIDEAKSFREKAKVVVDTMPKNIKNVIEKAENTKDFEVAIMELHSEIYK